MPREPTGSTNGFIGLLAGRNSRRACLAELNEAAASSREGFHVIDKGDIRGHRYVGA